MKNTQLWYFKKDKNAIVRAKFLRKNVLIQTTAIRLSMFDFIVDHCKVSDNLECYVISIKKFRRYFKPVPKLKQILLKEGFGI